MVNSSRDENSVPTLSAVSSSDGLTVIPIKADPNSHALMVDDNATGSDLGPTNAKRDQNDVPTLLAVSSVDGITPVVVYSTSDGKLMVDST